MGAFKHISSIAYGRAKGPNRQVELIVSLGLGLAITLLAGSSLAETDSVAVKESPASATVSGSALKNSVSTSPAPRAPSRSVEPPQIATAGRHVPPLTRAAAKQRIETMSPTRWLAQFGDVSIGRRE